jgi:hypothetical protein
MKKYAVGGMSPDEEADLQALKTLKQGDYDVGGPKRRFARGKVKRMKDGGMPDLTGDGKITRADVLKGRGVFKKGGAVKSSASKRADGCAIKGKTKGKMV